MDFYIMLNNNNTNPSKTVPSEQDENELHIIIAFLDLSSTDIDKQVNVISVGTINNTSDKATTY